MKQEMADNNSALSSVMGIMVLLLITMLSIALMILYTMPVINDMENMANAQRIEQAFTVFDSRTSKAALGESPLQTTSLSIMEGGVTVKGTNDSYNESQMVFIFLSEDSSWYDNFYQQMNSWNSWKSYENESDFESFTTQMGLIKYESEDRTIAYEGGGVWSRYPSGGTVMISPPEFHFNGETLTIPVMKVSGNTSISGSTDIDINVRSANTPTLLFPNTSVNSNFTNPLDVDRIVVFIKSEYYDGWAKYAETLAEVKATVDDANQTAIIDLEAIPEMGTIGLPAAFNLKKVNQSNSNPIFNYAMYLKNQGTDASSFNPSGMTFTASTGTKKITYEIKKDAMLRVKVSYQDDAIGYKETWEGLDKLVVKIDGSGKNANTTVDFTNTTYRMEYTSNNPEYSWDVVSPTTMTPNMTISKGDVLSINNLTQHYMKLMTQEGPITFFLGGEYQKVDVGGSTLALDYDLDDGKISYLHITSNELATTVS
ncbi:hypothetical protein V7O66_11675 [Methanolobus sp. ZRKC3]|uniref:DUF7289 family protein n=1 Tax=Methanolobus sp. ZRKC3 TaxID=3125786 RepID=UPI00324B759B